MEKSYEELLEELEVKKVKGEELEVIKEYARGVLRSIQSDLHDLEIKTDETMQQLLAARFREDGRIKGMTIVVEQSKEDISTHERICLDLGKIPHAFCVGVFIKDASTISLLFKKIVYRGK